MASRSAIKRLNAGQRRAAESWSSYFSAEVSDEELDRRALATWRSEWGESPLQFREDSGDEAQESTGYSGEK